MDISVTQLNRRLAVQLPMRLPLGLVFVVGRVENLRLLTGRKLDVLRLNGRSSRMQFDLVEKNHRLRCELSDQAAVEGNVEEGDLVRAGGHLVFDSQQADYFLLARDLDLVEKEEPEFDSGEEQDAPLGRLALTPVLADIKKRSEAARQLPEEMPYWVHRIAPPGFQPAVAKEELEETAVSLPPHAIDLPPLDANLVNHLSAAMDSDETIELTPELLAQYLPLPPAVSQPNPYVEAAPSAPAPAGQKHRSPRNRTERLIGGLILLIVLLTLIALVGVIFFL